MEEYVGKLWHRTISKYSDHRFPEAAVFLNDISDRLALQFHALGGHPSIQILPTQRTLWAAKPSLLSRFANVGDKTELAWADSDSIRLPSEIANFQNRKQNQNLYLWLLVFLSIFNRYFAKDSNKFDWLCLNQKITLEVLKLYPGIRKIYQELADEHLQYRYQKAYVRHDQTHSEQFICQAISNPGTVSEAIADPQRLPPVPLWLHPIEVISNRSRQTKATPKQSKQKKSGVKKLTEKHRRKGEIVDDPDGRSGLMAFRLESLFSWSEFINLDRTADDSDEDSAQKAADDMDILSISDSSETLSSRIKFDLDLPASEFDDKVLLEGILLPEWDFKKQQLLEDYCALKILSPKGSKPCAIPEHLKNKSRQLRAQFEQLKPEKYWLKNQYEGTELDIDNIIRYQTDVVRGELLKPPGLFKSMKHSFRDLSCLLLADLSLSTDAWVNNDARVIDVIRDSLFLFAEALDASGDQYAISGFSSVKRSQIRYYPLKRFSEPLDNTIRGNINAIEPGYYTRLGAAIRQATKQLLNQSSSQRLLLILTDGKPNDIDQYEGRYGIEDTKMAIQEAVQKGLQTFCITIDENANQYLPYLFGRDRYILVKRAHELPKKLIKLYSQLVAN